MGHLDWTFKVLEILATVLVYELVDLHAAFNRRYSSERNNDVVEYGETVLGDRLKTGRSEELKTCKN